MGSDQASASAHRSPGALGSNQASASAASSGDGALGSNQASASAAGRVKTPAAFRADARSSVYQNGPAFNRQAFLRLVAMAKLVNCPQGF